MLACWICGMVSVTWAQDAGDQPPRPGARPLPLELSVLEDPGRRLTIDEVAAPPMAERFRSLGAKPLHLGLTSSAVWLRFKLPDPPYMPTLGRSSTRMLELGKAIIDEADLYLPLAQPAGAWRRISSGTFYPRTEGSVRFRTPVLVLPAGLDPDRPIYLRLASRISLSMSIRLWSGMDFLGHSYHDSLTFGLILGSTCAMIIFNLLIFLSLRDRALVAYIFYVFSMLMAQLTLQGFLGSMLTFPQPNLAPMQAFFLACSMFFAALFTRVFLLSRQNAPFWDKLLNFFLYGPVVMAVLVLIGRLDLANPLGYVIASTGPLHAICTGIACLRRGFRSARFFLFAWSILVASVLIFEMVSLGVLPSGLWTAYVLPMGMALESLLLTLALSDRVKLLNRERQELARSQRRYQELSLTDGLTGLYNQRYLNSKLVSEIEHARRLEQPLSVLMLDLDDFKAYNDTYGHVAGDQMLESLARVLKKAVREGDVACRYGGEEFTVILPGTIVEAAVPVAERIRRGVEQLGAGQRGERPLRVTVSLGAAQLAPGEDAQGLIHRADLALYQAKSQGKNRCVSAPHPAPGQ